jgi:pantoate--beta-alanine ligase
MAEVQQGCDRIDYVALVDADDLSPVEGQIERPVTLLVAAHVGTTRLIDNLSLGSPHSD